MLPSSIHSGKLDWRIVVKLDPYCYRLCTCSLLSMMLCRFSCVYHCCCGWLWWRLPNSTYSMMQHGVWCHISWEEWGIWVFVGSDYSLAGCYPERLYDQNYVLLCLMCLSCTSYLQVLLKTLTVLCDQLWTQYSSSETWVSQVHLIANCSHQVAIAKKTEQGIVYWQHFSKKEKASCFTL